MNKFLSYAKHNFFFLCFLSFVSFSICAHSEENANPIYKKEQAPQQTTFAGNVQQTQSKKPFHTYVTIEKYVLENNGESKNPISHVSLELFFSPLRKDTSIIPTSNPLILPQEGQSWTIGNGEVQPIQTTFEIPFDKLTHDGFRFAIQIHRKGAHLLPCFFDVEQISEFNRTYTCHTDLSYQLNKKIAEKDMDKEGVVVRVFTDLSGRDKDKPKEAINVGSLFNSKEGGNASAEEGSHRLNLTLSSLSSALKDWLFNKN